MTYSSSARKKAVTAINDNTKLLRPSCAQPKISHVDAIYFSVEFLHSWFEMLLISTVLKQIFMVAPECTYDIISQMLMIINTAIELREKIIKSVQGT